MLEFNEERRAKVEIGNPPRKILISISDDLNLFEERLSPEFQKKIETFLEKSQEWMEKCIKQIKNDGSFGIELMSIFVLSEQTDHDLILGLLFRTESDREHGRGIKINAKSFAIIEYGFAEIAFC